MTPVDPITMEIVRHALIAAADEMKINLMRTAYNTIIYEVLDFSVGLFDRNGDIISQAAGLPIFLGNLGEAVKVVSQDVGLENFVAGDIYLINDTYTSGTHLNDVTVISPVFVDNGQELIGFAASRAHWLDMGGRDPGGWFTDTTEIYQEGLRMRSVRLYEAGKPNRSIFQIIRDNVRYADSLMGDLRAQIAAGRTGEQRFQAIVDHYGLKTVAACITQIHDEGEQISRNAVARMKDGVYSAEAFMDDDGVSVDRPKVKVTVTVSGEEMTIDLTGSEPQCAGPINCGLAATISGVRVAFKCVTSPFTPVTEGDFRPLKIVVPDDSMFNAQLPAPSGVYGIILMTLCDVIFKALAEAIPDQIPAAHYCDVCAVFIFGTDPRTGRPYLHVEPEGGGWGALANRDGENVLIAIADGDTRNVPVEVLEARFPLRVERYEVRQDSGGPGKFRGGLGHYRDYLTLDHDAFLTTVQERTKCPPWGLAGGKAAAVNALIVNPDTPEAESINKVNAKPVKSGSRISVRTGGGGGYGNPFERDSELVRLDVVRGYVSLEAAREAYGVALRPDTLQLDAEETQRLRSAAG
ncbi:MAG: hydantoinase B/oxoprolinase family protein [Anaerolineales bacterium]|nr:MAG: hydantoinase B/oxoprolinase family protein [Anaerolineales bacterium]